VMAGVGARRLGSRYERPVRPVEPASGAPGRTGSTTTTGTPTAITANAADPASAPAVGRDIPDGSDGDRRPGDTDSLDWWRQLDAGVDPTRGQG
jgi:hypothetical protein